MNRTHLAMTSTRFAALAALLMVVSPALARAQTPEAVEAPADERPFYLRVDVGAGYGHYVYPTAGRNGGGPMVSTAIAIAWHPGGGLIVGGWACFDPIVWTEGVSTSGDPWGPYFSANGFLGAILGFASDVFGIDVAIGVGGGGSHGAGGIGVVVAPTVSVALAHADRFAFGLYVRPELGALVDPATSRPVLLLAGTAGVSFRSW
jgi:hypothetical protein